MEGGFFLFEGWNFSKSVSVDSTFIRKMRVVGGSGFFFGQSAFGLQINLKIWAKTVK